MTTTTKTTSFQQLGLSAALIKALKENGFEEPFPIQEVAIPFILKGIDVIGQAHTGTGKTAAFALPILNKIRRNGPIQALVLAPTRELAVQITTEINKFARYTGIRTVAIYGGQSIRLQYNQLRRGIQIVVATPGRLIDHVKQHSIQLDNVKYVVLDEADRMLDMGFIDDIKFILFYINEDRQTCLFSATMPPEILRLAREYMHDVKEVRLNEEELSLDTIEQSYLGVPEKDKFKHLCNFIKSRDKKQTIVFAATKQRTQRLVGELKQERFKAISIHGDLSQRERDNAMYRFKKGIDDILVATDIAARGIDVPAVGHIINYDVPAEPLMYFHRIGRTARAGATGKAITLVSQDRVDDFSRILKKTKQPIRRLNEDMGIMVPIIKQRPYDRYQQRHRYWHKSGGNRNGGYHGGYGSNRSKRSYREQRGYNRKSRYRRESSRSYGGSK
ncbi:MAG TPA: DEAD/DEAH box helicase [Nitrososphaeraceae archaeon]|nr:DEAD/DEAH box helicase [Nitrososphaeraceae archaeon]